MFRIGKIVLYYTTVSGKNVRDGAGWSLEKSQSLKITKLAAVPNNDK